MENRSKKYQLIHAIPFLILFLLVLYTWFIFLSTNYVATWRHYLLLVLVLINLILYYRWFNKAILTTGMILILFTFFLLPPFKEIESAFINIGPVSIPWIEYWSFLILIIYCSINYNLLIDMYLDLKEKKKH